jgi:hypothetical protein
MTKRITFVDPAGITETVRLDNYDGTLGEIRDARARVNINSAVVLNAMMIAPAEQIALATADFDKLVAGHRDYRRSLARRAVHYAHLATEDGEGCN